MMKYDFESVLERQGMDAIAVDAIGSTGGMAPGAPKEGFDVIPMWVADMNFATVPTIPEESSNEQNIRCMVIFPRQKSISSPSSAGRNKETA